MSQAAKQLREYLEDKYDGVRISRKSCRDTAGGSVSQHSAYDYGEYDSNALDIMGGPTGWTFDQNVALINTIVGDVNRERDRWSVRLILWQVPDHYGHAHIDFWPTCLTHKWCGRDISPLWQLSTGQTLQTKNPTPENGLYDGSIMPREQWEQMIDALFLGRPDQFQGDPNYWKYQVPSNSPEWSDFWAAFVRAISLEGGTP